jgi:hypothetical protein
MLHMGNLYHRHVSVRVHAFLLAIGLSAALTGCSSSSFFGVNNSLLNPPGGGGPEGPSCENVLNTTTKKLRISFMVDDSGSTLQSDPNHNYRVATVEAFISKYGSKSNFTYSYGKFAGTSASVWDIGTNQFMANPAQPFGNASNLTSALNNYKATTPNGSTPYGAAFSKLKQIILADIQANASAGWEHSIVFMSDGVPTDVSNPQLQNVKNLVTSLVNDVKNAGSNAAVSGVYFGDNNANDAINIMRGVAEAGGGIFVNTNVTTNLQIDDVIQVPGVVCQ